MNALAACLAFDSCNAFNVKKFSPGNSKAQLHRKRLKVLKQILGRSEKQKKISTNQHRARIRWCRRPNLFPVVLTTVKLRPIL